MPTDTCRNPHTAVFGDWWSRATPLVHALLATVLTAGFLAGSVGAATFAVDGPAQRAACVNNLRQLGLVMALYANENQDKLPLRSQRPGNLMMEGRLIVPEYLAKVDVLGCPSDPAFDPTRSFRLAQVTGLHDGQAIGDPSPDCVDSTSYQYLGYAVYTDDDLREYARAWPHWERQRQAGASGDHQVAQHPEDRLEDPLVLATTATGQQILALGNGAEWFLNTAGVEAGDLPILWDRAASGRHPLSHSHPLGQNTLFLDGHVEFHPQSYETNLVPWSAYSHQWMGRQTPDPSGDTTEPWGDCP